MELSEKNKKRKNMEFYLSMGELGILWTIFRKKNEGKGRKMNLNDKKGYPTCIFSI